MKKTYLKKFGITLFFALFLYYFMLPPLNLQAISFWIYLMLVLTVYFLMDVISNKDIQVLNNNRKILKKYTYWVVGVFLLIGIIILVNFIVSPLFSASSYANRITIDETGSFNEDIPAVDFKTIPLLDKDSSRKLGDRTMGQMTELVSQFYVSDLYTQINYINEILRVTPLEYAGFIKYLTNRKNGITGYITVTSVDGDSRLVKLNNGMKYMPSAFFFENLDRKLRLAYPTLIFGQESFEIDNDGNPYWIVPTIKYVGIGMRKEINGIIILDPKTGESTKYDIGEIPNWVDHVYDANLIIEQVNNWGEYRNGFWNSIFGQKNVINTTEGYNYMAYNDDVYLYTGITSVSSDESNLGFILTNMRTKETNYYAVAGAEEYSAMASAEGLVQEKNYKASFPLLINLNKKPTYLMSLKDNAGLVKMYALVDVVDYQKVITSDASLGIEAAVKKYLQENDTVVDNDDIISKKIEIKSIKPAVIDGTTYYYFTDKGNNKYVANIKVNKNLLPFIEVGNSVEVAYFVDNDIFNTTQISK